MAYIFIGGPPTSGKTYLAEEISRETGVPFVSIDKLRKEICTQHSHLIPWRDFFVNKDSNYWNRVESEEYLQDCQKQTEVFWPFILKKISDIQKENGFVFFEGVDFLPVLLEENFFGIFLLCKDFDTAYQRNKLHPRLGKTDFLIRKEVELFLNETDKIKRDAIKHGYKSFANHTEAKKELKKLITKYKV